MHRKLGVFFKKEDSEGLMLSAFSGKEKKKKPFSISEDASDEWQIHGHDFKVQYFSDFPYTFPDTLRNDKWLNFIKVLHF